MKHEARWSVLGREVVSPKLHFTRVFCEHTGLGVKTEVRTLNLFVSSREGGGGGLQ